MKFNEFWAWLEERVDWKKSIERGYGFSEMRWKKGVDTHGRVVEIKIKDLNNQHLLNAITYVMRQGRTGAMYDELKRDARERGIPDQLIRSAISKGVAQRDSLSLRSNRY